MKKNILIIASKFPPEYSGPGVRILDMYKNFLNCGNNFSIKILCNGIEQYKNTTYSYEGFPVRRITGEYLNYCLTRFPFLPLKVKSFTIYQYEFFKSLWILFTSNVYRNTDLIHIFGNSGGTAAALLYARIKKIPVIMELVTALAIPHQKILGCIKIFAPQNSLIIALTQAAQKKALATGYPKSAIWCRPNPVKSHFSPLPYAERIRLRAHYTSFSNEDVVIATVAKIMPQKNQIFLLDVLKLLPPAFKLLIAGPLIDMGPFLKRDTEYFKKIEWYISEHALQDRVCILTGFVKSWEIMNLADLYAMPAWDEGFGTPMLEAMSCGLPVVANQSEKAFQEWIQPAHNGFLCSLDNPKSWAMAFEELAQFDTQQRTAISEEILKKAGQSIIYQQYETYLKSMLAK